jgi:NAD(P)-dependent dehydrogenase (short-subunit alcohol dehydrogenase family)
MAAPLASLTGRTALVTGGGSGIGAAIAHALDRAGATVSLLGRRPGPLAEVQATLAQPGRTLTADITDLASLDAALGQLETLDILINNAGAAESAPFAKTDAALLERMLAVNLTGAFEVTRRLLPKLRTAPHGRIVNVASTAGLKGYAYVSAYCAAKHGLVGLTRALAQELAATAVTVNAVCPGFTETALLERSLAAIEAATGRAAADARAELAGHNPQNRLIAPEEVAAAVLWLCQPAARGVTGQAIVIAGGEVT